MSKDDKPINMERVTCGLCLKEVPRSEATASEATDYSEYFCRLSCYEEWKSQSAKLNNQTTKSSS